MALEEFFGGELVMRMSRQGIERRRTPRAQSGTSLVELMVAMLVLAIGMLGPVVLISTAITSDNRNKLDTTATLLAQMAMEQIASHPPTGSSPLFTISDCRPPSQGGPQTWTIDTTGASDPGAGARVNSTGSIDFTQPYASVPNNYKMVYVACTPDLQVQSNYEVRWSIRTVDGFTKLVTVAARTIQAGGQPAGQIRLFAPPVTLRTLVGN